MTEDADPRIAALAQALEARYLDIAATHMAGVPICNPALSVAAEGFRRHSGRAVGIVVTPWFMNVVALDIPGEPPAPPARAGESRKLALPCGEMELIVGDLPGVGRIDSCSLFSPMQDFADMAAALDAARAAISALFEPEPPAPAPAMDRRAFLRGGRPAAEAGAP